MNLKHIVGLILVMMSACQTQAGQHTQFVNSMLTHFDSYGYLPIWNLWGQDNYCMIGNHAIPVVADVA